MRKPFFAICYLFLVNQLFAQINAPSNPVLAKKAAEYQVLSSDDMGLKDYRAAANSLHWLMVNVPDYYEGTYIYAYKAYEQLANEEVDKTKKKLLYDSMIISYQMKGTLFSLNDREKNNLAFKYYKYFKNDKDKISEALATYHEAYEYPENVINNNVIAYMDLLRRYKKFGNQISVDQTFEVYDKIMEVIEIKKGQGFSPKKLNQYNQVVNEILTDLIGNDEGEIDCKFIEDSFGTRLDKDKNFVDAKRVFTLMLNNDCITNPYYIKSAEIIWSTDPSAGIAKTIAKAYSELGDLEQASEWYEKAIDVIGDDAQKAVIKMNLANIYAANNEKSKARAAAFAAVNFDNSITNDAYSFVGNLYYNSFNDCKQSDDKFADYAVFMAAYDLYKKAGDTNAMEKAQAQFPTIAEVHTGNRTKGETIKIGCWINTTTKLKTRPTN